MPRAESWNQYLVKDTASLLVEALRWLRDHDFLDSTVLQSLPLDPTKFGDGSMFAPLFDATKNALRSESLLPRFDFGYSAADQLRLARTQELRDLFTPAQLAALYGQTKELFWLSAEITQERTPGLRRYLMQELLVPEVTPETIISRLSGPFLRAQPDSWILELYHFLNGQPVLRTRLSNIPLIRLQDGSHVPPVANNRVQAFLPGKLTTGFPTVRAAVCSTETAREFLRSLGLTEPNPVDDVIQNVLPRFRGSNIDVSTQRYEASVARILAAFDVDSKVQREKLSGALRDTAFVMAVDAGTNSKKLVKPTEVYLATERLKNLFDGVRGVLLVDDEYACLRGEDVRELLEACGALRYLRPVPSSSLPWEMLRELRAQVGHVDTSGQNDRVSDWLLSGLDPLLRTLRTLEKEQRVIKSQLLWEELAHLDERRGKAVFTGEYTWTHYGNYRNIFDAGFVRRLNSTAWVPDADKNLEKPEFVVFETLGWKADPFLLSKIHFKPRIIETLANQVGIEPGVLDLLKKLGLTSEADLRAKLAKAGIVESTTIEQETSIKPVDDAVKAMGLDDPTQGVDDPSARDSGEPNGSGSSQANGAVRGSAGGDNPRSSGSHGEISSDRSGTGGSDNGKQTVGGAGGRPFISYVGVHPDDEEPDLDGLDQPARMALEAQAIEFILSSETGWQRTPTQNPGFDLFESGPDGQAVRWCEVKAMTGCLDDRPVGLSRTQFDCAREHGESYWLYVVEHVGTGSARIVRIQDPARKVRTFTFDKGWRAVAEGDSST